MAASASASAPSAAAQLSSTNPTFNMDEVEMTSAFWFSEEVTADMVVRFRLNDITLQTKSEFQRIQVATTATFGKTLVLDGKTQSAEKDEFIYHECLVHPAMLHHSNPKRVYIGGGGEMATAREVLRHPSVEKCVMVDLDKVVVDVSREHLPEWGAGCWDDPRLEMHYTDAHAWLMQYKGPKFDVIIMDIADPIEAGPGYVLYTEEFYKFAVTQLAPGGVLVTQSGPGALHTCDECFTTIHKTLRTAFSRVVPYTVSIPSFGCDWGFNMAYGLSGEEAIDEIEVAERKSSATNALIKQKIKGELRFMDGAAHLGIFGIPKWLRTAIEQEDRIMTVDNPVYMH